MKKILKKSEEKTTLSTRRIEALHDGVFAIVMTLLVLELKVPEASLGADILTQFLSLLPLLLGYVVTFINLGIYWIGQQIQHHYVVAADRIYAWINVLFLMFISLLPFTSLMLDEYPDEQLSYILYGVNLIAIGCTGYFGWCYATKFHRLTEHSISDTLIASVKRRILVAPLISVLAILLSFFAMRLSLLLYILILPYYIIPGKIDRFWKREAVAHSH